MEKPTATGERPADRAAGRGDEAAISPLEGFTGDITQPKLSLLYTVGLAVVAFAMVLLPVIYIGLIILVGWGIWYHLAHDFAILGATGNGMVGLIFYVGPAVAGGILIFFMLKPLLARRAKRAELPKLDPDKEKLLFTFVRRICELVRAPVPSRIDLDCQVNASARFRRGLLSGDLVLTIGLPLTAGLDMREFAGVLAHEFGHFAQGAGMRLTYIIRNINFWFARVVYERDKWDQQLERTAKRTDYRISLILHAARGCVWVTRRILWALMHAGNAISCFMLRQMEFDADGYETKVAGSAAFESVVMKLRELNAGAQLAVAEARQGWASHRLPEDYPLLVRHKAGTLPEASHKLLTEQMNSAKTGWFHTHPADPDRIRAARALNEPGVFTITRPAAELFSDFSATSREVTRHLYENNWKLKFTAENLVSSGEMLDESAANAEAGAAIGGFYGAVDVCLVPLFPKGEIPAPEETEKAKSRHQSAKDEMAQLLSAAEKFSAECLQKRQQLVQYNVARLLTAANFRIKPAEFGLDASSNSVAEQSSVAKLAFDQTSVAVDEQLRLLGPFMAALQTRVAIALQLQREAGVSADEPLSIDNLLKTVAAVGSVIPKLDAIGVRLRPFLLLAKDRPNHPQPGKVDQELTPLAEEIRKYIREIQTMLGSIGYPFPHPRGSLSIVEYARHEKPCKNELEKAYHDGNSHVERLFTLYQRALGRLLVAAAKAEKQMSEQRIVAGGQSQI